MTVKEYCNQGWQTLLPLYAKEEATSILSMVLAHFCGLPAYIFYSDPDKLLPDNCLRDLQIALDGLAKGRPIQYILGAVVFEGCTICVREGVLIPRPETAELVRWAKSLLSCAPAVLDLCTGSGAIAIALAKAFPKAKVAGMDISEEALGMAKENSRMNNVEVDFFRADVLDAPSGLPESLDLIICNPPYVRVSEKAYMRPNVLNYEPHVALFVPDGDPLLFYRALADWGMVLLREGGLLMAEINECMDKEVEKLLSGRGYSSVAIRKDLNEKPRMCCAVKSFAKASPIQSIQT